ncbi:hypothetical protein F5B20DRAFT_114873 [Whalleya microplaca]|nr:hypothetical protein F5B20DRAFT_114873 [Whalleya microplaca]
MKFINVACLLLSSLSFAAAGVVEARDACSQCADNLGASDCGPGDSACLVQQCEGDADCQACGESCDRFGE